jgi:hypothetical protein
MSDVENYIKQRKLTDYEFADNFESGYLSFQLRVILRRSQKKFWNELRRLGAAVEKS